MNRNILFSLLALSSALLLTTCEKVPDYCGKGEWYDPSCEFCFSQKAYPLCGGKEYNPLTQGCYRGVEVGSLCLDGGVVPIGTPCGGYALSTRAVPEIGGFVEPNPNKQSYEAGESVVVSALPAGGYDFIGWAGMSADNSSVTVKMDADKPMVAMFISSGVSGASRTLVTVAVPQDGGEIRRYPEAANDIYGKDAAVGIKAVPKDGYKFDGWSGSQASASDSLGVLMDGNKTLVAMFKPIVYTFSARTVPEEGGAVFVNGTAFSRPVSSEFGAVIEALAVPAAGYVFSEWSGAASGRGNPVKISVTKGDMAIVANFTKGGAEVPLYTVTIEIGTTGASVKGSYASGETVTVSVRELPDGQRFINWTTETLGVKFADAYSETTTFIMPPRAVTVTANFE